jgi:hypothetical protein
MGACVNLLATAGDTRLIDLPAARTTALTYIDLLFRPWRVELAAVQGLPRQGTAPGA